MPDSKESNDEIRENFVHVLKLSRFTKKQIRVPRKNGRSLHFAKPNFKGRRNI